MIIGTKSPGLLRALLPDFLIPGGPLLRTGPLGTSVMGPLESEEEKARENISLTTQLAPVERAHIVRGKITKCGY